MDILQAIVGEYGDEVVPIPTMPDDWCDLSDKFGSRLIFHHACGALDGKHIATKNSGSVYHNYIGFFSIILLGLVDAEYKFIWVDVCGNGSTSDCAVFNNSEFKEALEVDTLGLPPEEGLSGDEEPISYFLIGDDAYTLRMWMMKPYSAHHLTEAEMTFNYRLSRAS